MNDRFCLKQAGIWDIHLRLYHPDFSTTVKSDDVQGRVKTYEAIVKGEPIEEPSIPASFRVLVKELQSLGLSVEAITDTNEVIKFGKDEERARRAWPPVCSAWAKSFNRQTGWQKKLPACFYFNLRQSFLVFFRTIYSILPTISK